MATQTFNLSLPKELVKKLDAQAKRDFSSRSDYVRKAILNQLKREQVLESKVASTGKSADNSEVIAAAKKILKDYRKDFENLSKR
ncbi:MAG: ribbon-helix-helix domain-containing protein [Patescibacteria group bacterium]